MNQEGVQLNENARQNTFSIQLTNSIHSLKQVQAIPLLNISICLERNHKIIGTRHRAFFSLFQEQNHSFVFDWPVPDSGYFQELSGLRKTCYFLVREANSNEYWELHLKPSKERAYMFAYVINPDIMKSKISAHADALLRAQKIPLVLDLDDTVLYF